MNTKTFQKIYIILIFYIVSIPVFSQSYSATWERIYPKNAPSKRASASMINIGNNKVLLFGGEPLDSNTNSLNDTWIFDLNEKNWTKINSKLSPSGRYGHDMLTLDSNTVFLFGGVSDDRENFQRDVWYFDIKSKEWNLVLKDTSNSPPEMIWWPMCKISNDSILVYGYDSECCGFQFYYNVKSKKWFKDDLFRILQPRNGTKFINFTDNFIYVFGGYNMDGGAHNDNWVMNKNDLNWEQIFPKNSPPKLYDFSLNKISNNFAILYGGFKSTDSCHHKELWLFDFIANNWFDITPEISPKGRTWHSMSNLNDSTLILFSGNALCHLFVYTNYTDNDTWLLHLTKNKSEVDNSQTSYIPITFNEKDNEIVIEGLEQNTEVKVYNSLGITINTFKFLNNNLIINKFQFQDGVYFLQFYNSSKIFTHKFLRF